MNDLFQYLPLLFVAFGLVLILVSIRGIINGRRFVQQAQRVQGVVSDVRTRFTGRGEHLRANQWPVLTFTTLEGREITTEAATTSNLGTGDETEVLYDPQDPTTAMPAENTGGSYGGIVAGLIAIVIGVVFFFGVWDGFGFWGGGSTSGCELQRPDGSVESVACPPGLGIGG
ncbi:DUF3592 domain-containing protein [Nonomuraea sp. NPDC050022]|uniref:DUF3592 domain-containing protein n=1 Tax=unclassified Nonomuraea TaxID=2593643 RepID=UPI0033CEAAEA